MSASAWGACLRGGFWSRGLYGSRARLLLGCVLGLAAGSAAQPETIAPLPEPPWESETEGHKPSLVYPVAYMLTGQAIGIAVLASMDRDETNFKEPSWRNFREAFTQGPVYDGDSWYYNYVGHPLWGSETYLRARGQGFDPLPAFLFSTASSVLWEFGFEGWWQRPSIQDLVVTSTSGAVLGEIRFHLKRSLRRKNTPVSRTLAVLIDPLQALAESSGRLAGRNWTEPAFRTLPSHTASQGFRAHIHPVVIARQPGLVLHCAW